jgi:CMP-N,N'-diacetyllegionaminic acid synthase
MIGDLSVVAIIGARGNSKGLPRKNVAPLGGRPLLEWSIAAAAESVYIDGVCVTSDDAEILAVAEATGDVTIVHRPDPLATDTARVEDAILHALDTLEEKFNLVVLLQPTSPLRTASDIDGTIEACISAASPAAVSVTTPSKSPYWMCTMRENGTLKRLIETDLPIHRRQDLPEAFAYNGAVYVARTEYFCEHQTFFGTDTVGYFMPPERSIDIDTELDLKIAESVISGSVQNSAKPGIINP